MGFGYVANFLDDVFGGGNSAGADSIFKSSGYGFCHIKTVNKAAGTLNRSAANTKVFCHNLCGAIIFLKTAKMAFFTFRLNILVVCSLRHLLCPVRFPNQQRPLNVRQIPPPQLIPAHPDDGRPLVGKFHLLDLVVGQTVLLDDLPTVVAVVTMADGSLSLRKSPQERSCGLLAILGIMGHGTNTTPRPGTLERCLPLYFGQDFAREQRIGNPAALAACCRSFSGWWPLYHSPKEWLKVLDCCRRQVPPKTGLRDQQLLRQH